jgi:hypothetical protein
MAPESLFNNDSGAKAQLHTHRMEQARPFMAGVSPQDGDLDTAKNPRSLH